MKAKIFFISLVCNLLICNAQLLAGWELLQNSPTTNELHSVFFVNDNTGWIAGYNNTIYKTTNSGQTWAQQTSPESSNFECITFVDANTGWACGSSGVVIKTTNGGANWFSQTFTASRFNSMDFIDANTGFICGDNGNIRKTLNGGTTWNAQVSGVGQNLHEIRCYVNDIVFAVGNNAIILRTTNYGINWEVKSGPGIGSQIFYSLGHNSYSYNRILVASGTLTKYSTDEGSNWYIGEFPLEPIYSISSNYYNFVYGVGANGYNVSFNYNGFIYDLPSPVIENLNSIFYSNYNNTAWSVGNNGSIMKFFTNWMSVPENYNMCSGIDFIDQNTGWAIIDDTDSDQIIKTINGGNNWILQNVVNDTITSIKFINSSTGFAAGINDFIIKTTNGGNSWFNINSNNLQNWLSADFFNSETGWLCGSGGKIVKTTNGGNNWNILTTGINNTLRAIKFTNPNTGWAAGDSGKIIKTENGGQNWYLQNSGTFIRINLLNILDASTALFITDEDSPNGYSHLFKTINGGSNWVGLTQFPYKIKDMEFIDHNIGFVCASYNYGSGYIKKTLNGGNNWESEELVAPISPTSMEFIVQNNTIFGFCFGTHFLTSTFEYLGGEPPGNSGNYPGWVAVQSNTTGFISAADYINPFVAFGVGGDPGGPEQGLVLRTINGGQTWTRQQSTLTASALNDVSFADVNNGIAVGSQGKIIHTTNGGANWVQQTSGTTFPLESVDMLDVNNAFVCGSFGRILYTSNGGANWQTQGSGSNGLFFAIDYINSTTATVVGFQGEIRRTTNTGASWFQQPSGGTLNFSGVQFIDVNTGIVISNEGPVLRTTNGGLNWVQTDSLSGYAADISYIDANNVFIVTQFAGVSRIYRSTNGGLSWILQTTDFANYGAVSFTDANNGFITGTDGLILRTSNAGVISGTNTSYSRNGLGLLINDLQSTNDSVNVNVTDNPVNIVTRVYLRIDTVLHTNDSDLEFYLEHNGITDTLIYRSGGSGDNFFGTFLNDATNFPLVSGSAPFRGSYKPNRPLSKFNGQSPNGYWKLRIYDAASGNIGTLDAWSLIITYTNVIGITGNQNIPTQFKLYQNYPNPFNPVTKIKFSLPHGNDLLVKLRIYDILGREVTTLINQQLKPGSYQLEWDASAYASGIYFYRIESESFTETKKMVLVK